MYDLDTLVKHDTVKACVSLFPVSLNVDSSGMSPVRFVIAQSPSEDDPHWVAAAWRGSSTGGEPNLVFASRIATIESMSTKSIALTTDNGRRVRVQGGAGCGCGSRLKTYRPFGNARLVQVPRPAF